MDIHTDHPRRKSLASRQKIVDAQAAGMLADSALIAHGRGEAFDYLLGEKTIDSARQSQREAVNRLFSAQEPVISMNGNSTILAGKNAVRLAALTGSKLEVNIFYRTEKRMNLLLEKMKFMKDEVMASRPPKRFTVVEWKQLVSQVEILGAHQDSLIPGLEGPRARCCSGGIFQSDVILVPLEDGDRCQALISMSKQVIAVDLNPLSRTSRFATVTIVDEVARAFSTMTDMAVEGKGDPDMDWDNQFVLESALNAIGNSAHRISELDD